MAAGNATPEDSAAALSQPQGIAETDEGETVEPATVTSEPASTPEETGETLTSNALSQTATDDLTPAEGDSESEAAFQTTETDADVRDFEALVSGNTEPQEETENDILTLEEPADEETTPPASPITAEAQTEEETPGTTTAEASNAPAPNVGERQGSGLSDEERGDLEKLIKGFNEDTSGGVSTAVVEKLQKQIKLTEKRMVKLGKMALANDKRLKSCYKIMRLQQKKAEIMNQRIDALVDALNNGKPN